MAARFAYRIWDAYNLFVNHNEYAGEHARAIHGVCFSPDGRGAITGSWDKNDASNMAPATFE